jgi:uroporphyrinogen decarboxylase
MNHLERLQACIGGGPIDRPPVALWRHFPVDDQTPQSLAAAVLAFQRTYDFDLVKLTPASSFCLKDWGVQDEWRGSTEGTREYTQPVIVRPEDWERLPVLDPFKGHLGEQLTCLRLLIEELGPQVPVLQTVFNPLAQAKNLAGKNRLLVHLRSHPDLVHAGLKIIAETTRRFIEEASKTGIAGLFYAAQHAQLGLLSIDEYQSFGTFYDLQLLEASQDLWLNMLHLHGEEIMFDQLSNYPVAVINWHDRDTYPSLKEARERYSGVI